MLALLPLLALAGCAQPGCVATTRAELLFGLSTPTGTVTTQAFDAFLDRSVTPRFPAGLTVLDGAGRWQSVGGHQTSEPSKLVLIVFPPGPGTGAALNAIRDEYRVQFQQQSVGLVVSKACASF